MKSLISSVNVVIIVLVLLYVGSLFGMEDWDTVVFLMHEKIKQEHRQYKQQAQEADCYNCNHPLLTLPKEIVNHIFTYCCSQQADQVKSLIESMKNLMQLSRVCKKYNDLLTFETIGKYSKNYAQEDKDKALKKILDATHDHNYKSMRVSYSILLHVGSNPNVELINGDTILFKAVLRNDEQLVKQLFEYNANPNQRVKKWLGSPVFFYIESIALLKLFLAQKSFNVHATNNDGENVLCHVIAHDECSVEFVKLYLDRNVDAKKIVPLTKSCLLHQLAFDTFTWFGTSNRVEKGELILGIIPDSINLLNAWGATPLDIAQKSLKEARRYGIKSKFEVYEKLIELYKQHGACRASDLD